MRIVERQRQRWGCPECGRPVGRNGGLLAPHGDGCPGTGTPLTELADWDPDNPAPPIERRPPRGPWIPRPEPVDRTAERRMRGYGWTEQQIAALSVWGETW